MKRPKVNPRMLPWLEFIFLFVPGGILLYVSTRYPIPSTPRTNYFVYAAVFLVAGIYLPAYHMATLYKRHPELLLGRPICAKCFRKLTILPRVQARGVFAALGIDLGSDFSNLYNGMVCPVCRRAECGVCKLWTEGKPTRIDAPCPWCGGTVSPAFVQLFEVSPSRNESVV